MGPKADLEALGKRIISFSCWESNQDSSVSCSFILPRCSIKALCIYSVLDETCATVALSVNRAVSGGQFPSEDIATLTHSVTTLLSLWSTPAASTYTKSFDGRPVAGSLPFKVTLRHRQMPTSCFGIEHADYDLCSLISS